MTSTESTLAALPKFDVMPASTLAEMNNIDNLDRDVDGHFPMNMLRMKSEQDKDEELHAKLSKPKHKEHFGTKEYGGIEVITYKGLIVIPPPLQSGIIQ